MKPYYEHDGITIYHGDCREILPCLDEFGVVVTDPPYGIGWTRGVNAARNSKPHDGILNDDDTTCRDEALAMIGGKPAIVFGSFYAPPPCQVRQVLVWHKPADAGLVGATTGFRRDAEPIFLCGSWPTTKEHRSSILHVSRGQARTTTETGHPHTKPVGIMTQLIERCPPGVVLDPFAGSGSTLVAARMLGRRATGIEIEERYCEIAAKRLSQGVLDLT